MKKLILILSIIVFFFGFKFASAEVTINEVQIAGSTTNDEFIELYNSGESTVDLTGWYIQKIVNSSGNAINLVAQSRLNGKSILGNNYFLLAKEGGYTGDIIPDVLWPSSSSYILANNNSLILYRGNETDKDEVNWENIEEGKSIQKTTDGWITASPTPKAANQDSGGDEGDDEGEDTEEDDSSDAEEDSSESETETKATATPTLKTKILAKTLAFAGQPAEFSLDVKYGSFTYTTGKYFWNFGDGDSREVINQPGRIFHTYFYPGEYAVSSEYYKSYLSQVPDVVSKITIKVVPLTVSISKVGDAKDFFIELTNNSSYEIDISRWAINANGKVFVFPKNTAILSKKQTTVSGRITGFVSGDERNLKLISSAGDVVFDYNSPIVQTEIIKEVPAPVPAPVSAPVKIPVVETQNNNAVEVETPEVEIPDQTQILPTQIPADILPAAVVQSDIDVKESSNKYLFLGGLAGFLIITGGFVYFLRRNRVPANLKEGSDFKILDE